MNNFDLSVNINTSPETLDSLANDAGPYIRRNVAGNPNTLPETLERLANDGFYWVRYWVAKNPNTPQYIKDYLKIKRILNCYE